MDHWCRMEIPRVVFASLWVNIGGHHLQSFSKTDACLPSMDRTPGQYVFTRHDRAKPPMCTRLWPLQHAGTFCVDRVTLRPTTKIWRPSKTSAAKTHDLSETFTAGCVRLEPRECFVPEISFLLGSTLSRDLIPPAALVTDGLNCGVLLYEYIWESGQSRPTCNVSAHPPATSSHLLFRPITEAGFIVIITDTDLILPGIDLK